MNMKKILCLHAHTKYVRENEIEVIEECLDCGHFIRVPRELIGD
jgi:hypothetical protein